MLDTEISKRDVKQYSKLLKMNPDLSVAELTHLLGIDQEEVLEIKNMSYLPTLNTYANESHNANIKWWKDINTGEKLERNTGELIALMHSELSEALEGARKNKMDDHLPHRKSLEVELADTLIRIFDFAGAYELDLEGAYQEKMAYNAKRSDHTHEQRRLADGKKF